MWPSLTIGVVFTETVQTPTCYGYTSQSKNHTKSHVHFYYFLSIYPLLQNFLNLKFFPLILAENPMFSVTGKKFSKFSLIPLVGGNPARLAQMVQSI